MDGAKIWERNLLWFALILLYQVAALVFSKVSPSTFTFWVMSLGSAGAILIVRSMTLKEDLALSYMILNHPEDRLLRWVAFLFAIGFLVYFLFLADFSS